jgi:hypothetical protein
VIAHPASTSSARIHHALTSLRAQVASSMRHPPPQTPTRPRLPPPSPRTPPRPASS